MKKRLEQIKEFLSDEKKLKALVNDEEFIGKVSGGKADTETYKEELKKLGLEISTDEAKQIENTVNKLFETPTEKIKLDDDFLKEISGGSPNRTGGSGNNSAVVASSSSPSSQGLSPEAIIGMSVGIPVAAWLGSGIGCAVAASVYRKQGNKDKFHNCATAAFHILNAPLLPLEAGAFVLMLPEIATMPNKPSLEDLGRPFTHPVETIFGVDVD